MNDKQQAAYHALQLVQPGMQLGLGTGSTAAYFLEFLAQALAQGSLHDIIGVPTSERTRQQAQALGIPLAPLAELGTLDLAVDGADEIDPALNLIKGLGRALLREKIIAVHARRFVIIADHTKLVPRLGQGPLPVELVRFEAAAHVRWLRTLADRAELWLDDHGQPYLTDNGNYLARLWFDNGIPDLPALARALDTRPGIVDHGLFLNLAHQAILAGPGGLRVLEREQ